MNKANHLLKAALAAAGLVGTVTLSTLPAVAVAQDPKPPKLNSKVQKALAGAQEAIQAKDWAKAAEGLEAAKAVEGKGPYDEFMISELSGFVHACGLVRPDGIATLEPKSVRKKLKQPSFAAGVHRDEVYAGAELLGLELDEHITNVVQALRPIAGELGLRTG